MSWIEAAKDVGIFAIVAGIFTYLFRFFMDKRFKAYEAEINLASYKTEKLHYIRLEIISKLYQKIVKLDYAMREMTAMFKPGGPGFKDEERKRIKKSGEAFNDASIYFSENEIYFTEETCNRINQLIKKYSDNLFNYEYTFERGTDSPIDQLDIYKNISEDIPEIRNLLKIDLRRIINVVES